MARPPLVAAPGPLMPPHGGPYAVATYAPAVSAGLAYGLPARTARTWARETPVPATPPSVPGPVKAPGRPSPAQSLGDGAGEQDEHERDQGEQREHGQRGQPRPPAAPRGARARRPCGAAVAPAAERAE